MFASIAVKAPVVVAADTKAGTARTIDRSGTIAESVWIDYALGQQDLRGIRSRKNQVGGVELIPVRRHREPGQELRSPDDARSPGCRFFGCQRSIASLPDTFRRLQRSSRHWVEDHREVLRDREKEVQRRGRKERFAVGTTERDIGDRLIAKGETRGPAVIEFRIIRAC